MNDVIGARTSAKHAATVTEMIAKFDDVIAAVNEQLEPLRAARETGRAMWTVLILMATTGLILTELSDMVELPTPQ